MGTSLWRRLLAQRTLVDENFAVAATAGVAGAFVDESFAVAATVGVAGAFVDENFAATASVGAAVGGFPGHAVNTSL